LVVLVAVNVGVDVLFLVGVLVMVGSRHLDVLPCLWVIINILLLLGMVMVRSLLSMHGVGTRDVICGVVLMAMVVLGVGKSGD
jgi:predicted permease